MNEAVTISATSLEDQNRLETQVEEQKAQIEQLKESKALLQKAMLDQLSAVRQQLHLERSNRIAAESEAAGLRDNGSDSSEAAAVKPKRRSLLKFKSSSKSTSRIYYSTAN